MLQTSQHVVNTVRMIKKRLLQLKLFTDTSTGNRRWNACLCKQFLSQLSHLKEQGLERTSECKWDWIEQHATNQGRTKEDNRTKTLFMGNTFIPHFVHFLTGEKDNTLNKNIPSGFGFRETFDLLIKLGIPPLSCNAKWSRELCPSLNLFIRRNLCPFHVAFLIHICIFVHKWMLCISITKLCF